MIDKDKPYIIDDADWADEISDVKPLKGQDKKLVRQRSDSYEVDDLDDLPTPAKHSALESMEEVLTYPEQELVLAVPKCNDSFINCSHSNRLFRAERAGADPRILKKLNQGKIPYEDRLDLHGYLESEAWSAMTQFLHQSYHQGLRCVLLIHGKGKGYGEGGEMGIIKTQVCSWLENNNAVLAYHTCIPRHGGSGAVYVLIRRKRQV